MTQRLLALTGLLLASCSATPTARNPMMLASEARLMTEDASSVQRELRGPPPPSPAAYTPRPRWDIGRSMAQGYFGWSEYSKVEVDGANHVDGDRGDMDEMPVIGGGAQYKLGGEKIDYGLEGLFDFGWRSDGTAFVVGGGGAAVAVDTSLFEFELFGGPFANIFLGDKVRVYGGLGPVFQFASYDQDDSIFNASGSGFGYGYYTRTGIEFQLPNRMWIGIGARWADTKVDLSDSAGDLNMEGFQFLITFSQGV
jgi:hypothetical protein